MQPKNLRRTIAYWLRLIVFFAVTLWLALGVVVGLREAYATTHPARGAPCCLTPADFGFEFESVTFPARDGLTIAGWYIPSQNGAAVTLAHSFSSHRAMTLPVAAMLAESGYGVLMFDLRAHGESEGELFTLWQAGDDVLGAVDYLQGRADVISERIGVWGFSAGAAASVHAAAQSQAIQVVVADGLSWTRFKDTLPLYRLPTLQYILNDLVSFHVIEWYYASGSTPRALVDDVALIAPRPLHLIVAADNPYGNETLAAEHYRQIGGESVSIWTIPGTVHGGGWDLYPDDYRDHLLAYFDAVLKVETE
jgi:acetyl esterase/lipase